MLDTQPDIRYSRPVYFGPGCDVAGADMVSVVRKTAFDADELGLTLPVRLVDGSAFGTRLARVSGINSFYSHAFGASLVADERPKLPECPRMYGCALVLTNGYPAADALEIFEGDAASGVFSLTHNRLADDVIRVRLKPLLSPSELLEVSLRASSSSRLKTCSELGYTGTNSENIVPRMGLTVRVEGKVANAQVNAQPSLGVDGGPVGHVHGHEEVELAMAMYEVSLTSYSFKACLVVVPNGTWNGETAIDGEQADAVETVLERIESLVVGDGTKGLEGAELRFVPPVDLADLADSADGVLGREAKLTPNLVVEELLKLEFIRRLKLERFHGKPRTRFVHTTHCREKAFLLLGRSEQFYGGDELHGLRLTTSKQVRNQNKGAALLPRRRTVKTCGETESLRMAR